MCPINTFFLLSYLESQALAAEMSPDTRVNCVAPGFVPTYFADFITSNEQVVSSY